jgi:hypothetical protein
MPPIPRSLPARARAQRLVAVAGICCLVFGLAGTSTAAAADEGRVYAFGKATDLGSPAEALAGLAVTPSGGGYWTVTPSGAVRAFGDAPDLGQATNHGAVVDIAATRSGRGYLVALANGGVLAFGDARFLGSMGGKPLAAPIVGITVTPTSGYWLVASDGGVFSFGDARFLGSMGGTKLVAPITAIAATPSGRGYWMAAEDGGVFSFGDAQFRGSFQGGGVTSMAASPRGMGYWLVAGNGDVYRFGDAAELGDLQSAATVIDIAPRPQADGFWLATGTASAAATAQYRAAADEPSDADFDRLAQCEAGGNWAARGSYEGGLQFLNSTWLGYGGGEFAQHAYDAPREAQIEIGRRVWRDRGWGAWPSCSRQLGYR